MSFLPDIVDGKLVEKPDTTPFTPPRFSTRIGALVEDQRLEALNNLDHDIVAEDFSDSPALGGYGKNKGSRVSYPSDRHMGQSVR